jgi:hypothetical protein
MGAVTTFDIFFSPRPSLVQTTGMNEEHVHSALGSPLQAACSTLLAKP